MQTITIEGRKLTVSFEDAKAEGTVSVIGEIVLRGPRSEYVSGRMKATGLIFFYNANTRSRFPKTMFDGMQFVLDNGTLRPATRADIKN